MILTVILLIGLMSVGVLAVAYLSVALRLRRPKGVCKEYEPVTILKPLKGVDVGLEENLRAIFSQAYPSFEVILGAEDSFDPALSVARSVATEFPQISAKVIAGGAPSFGANPKVRILRRLIEFASHETVLISDSNVRPESDYLATMVAVKEREGADLVHTVLVGEGGESFGGRLEELQLNGWVAASICFAQASGHPCVIGKSMLMRRGHLREEGALSRMQDILAEDYSLGRELHRAHKVVALAPYRLPVVTGDMSLRAFFNRHVRWGQMRRRIAPACFLAELSANATPFLLLSMLAGDRSVFGIALGAQVGKWLLDVVFYANFARHPQLKTALLIPLKDLIVPILWVVSAVKRTVCWRGNLMWIGPESRLSPVSSPVSESRGFTQPLRGEG